MTERRTVLFAGRVQGVGFRATTERLAEPLAVTGTVGNRPDGRVELVVEGTPAEVARLLACVREAMREKIDNETTESSEATGEFDRFAIRY